MFNSIKGELHSAQQQVQNYFEENGHRPRVFAKQNFLIFFSKYSRSF